MRKQVKNKLIENVLYDTHRAGFMNVFRNKELFHEIKYEW